MARRSRFVGYSKTAGALALLLALVACSPAPPPLPTSAAAPPPPTSVPPKAAASTAPAPAAAPPLSGSLIAAVSSFGNENVDPSKELLLAVGQFGAPMYDWLVWPNPDGSVSPGLAESWQEAPDKMSWTFKLRANLHFQNGDPITAEDVKFSVERHLAPDATSSLVGVWRAKVASVDAVSPDTVRFNLKAPWPVMPRASMIYEGAQATVLPKSYFERVGADGFAAAPIGSGPWQMVRHDPGIRFAFRATGVAHPFRARPSFQNLEVQLVPEASTRLARVKAGEVQIAEINPDQLKDVQNSGLQVLQIPNFTHTALTFFGWGNPKLDGMPTGDVRVRHALSIAINRQELIDTILGGYATLPARFVVGPGTLGHDPSWQPEAYDPQKARQLLADAGYANGFTIKLWSAPSAGAGWIPTAVEAIAGYWQAIGVRTEIVPTDFGTVASLYRQHPHPDQLVGTAMINISQVTQTNLTLIDAYYASNSVVYLLPSEKMDGLVKIADQASSEADLARAITDIVNYAHSEYVAYPLAITPALYAASGNIGSWTPYTSGYLGMSFETVRPK